jgi:thymidine kinase
MLVVIIGPMYSGKSTALLSYEERYTIAKKRCLLINHIFDNRYSENHISTHSGKNSPAIKIHDLDDVAIELIENNDVILLDEGQFYKNLVSNCVKYLKMKKIVIVSGLNGSYTQHPIGEMQNLLAYANRVEYKTAVCTNCGDDAMFSKKIARDENKDEIIVGSTEKYVASCFNCL